MPTATFFNLDEEKRDRFTKAAFQEFCLHDYKQASVSQIVKKVGIAKGSVYQYFENKADLYQYLYELATKKKAEYVQASPLGEEEDFFEWIERLWATGLRFDAENPLYTGFLYNISQEKDPVAHQIMEQNRGQARQFFEPLFRQLQEKGQMRKDVDMDFLVFFFSYSAESLTGFMIKKHGGDYQKLVQGGKPFMSVNPEAIMEYVHQLSQLLRTGMMPS
ncbi:MAG: TetR/AcrR family transcriptional regulator [Bacteroidota bacterium]